MDPDETLKQIRKLLEEGNSDEAGFLFYGLDEWLSKGGFLPKDWAKHTGQVMRPLENRKETDRERTKRYDAIKGLGGSLR